MLNPRPDPAAPPLLVAAGALLDATGRVLVQRRPAGRQHGGLWEFPGGKVEAGEAPAAALARELAEELDLVVDPADCVPLAFASEPPLLLLLFRVGRWRGEPRPRAAEAIAWHRPADLAALAMPPADLPLVAAVRAAATPARRRRRSAP